MKLRDFKSFLFVNPSENLIKVSEALLNPSVKAGLLFDSFFLNIEPGNLYFIENGQYKRISLKNIEHPASEDKNPDNGSIKKILKFKKGFFEKRPKPEQNRQLKDTFLLNNGAIKNSVTSFQNTPGTHDTHDINDAGTLIISSKLKKEDCHIKHLSLKKLTKCQIEEEFIEALGKDYYIFLRDNRRVEMFFHDRHIFFVTDADLDKNEIFNAVPPLKKFDFTILDESLYQVNENNFLVKHKKNIIIPNDYSYFGVSIKMPYLWYEKLGRFLWEGSL